MASFIQAVKRRVWKQDPAKRAPFGEREYGYVSEDGL